MRESTTRNTEKQNDDEPAGKKETERQKQIGRQLIEHRSGLTNRIKNK